MIFALAFWMILPGILGARAVYVIEYWRRDFWPVYEKTHDYGALIFSVVNAAAGGLVVYGSFIGGMLGLWLYWRRYRIPLLATADLVAPSLVLGLALGRIGCFLNGCCFGGACDLPWKVTFPWGSPVQQSFAKDGSTAVDGLRFGDATDGRATIEALDADSPAAKSGLTPGMEITAINGDPVTSQGKSGDAAPSLGCSCFRGSDKPTAREMAADAVLRIEKLDITLQRPDGAEFPWTVDDPPAAQVERAGPCEDLRHGNRRQRQRPTGCQPPVAGWPVRSPEAAAGIQEGDTIRSVSGYSISTIGQLRGLLDEHRRQAWLLFGVVGQSKPIRIERRSSSSADPAGPSDATL